MHAEDGKLTSDSLAALIADALADAGLLARDKLQEAVEVITIEIDARKGVGDY